MAQDKFVSRLRNVATGAQQQKKDDEKKDDEDAHPIAESETCSRVWGIGGNGVVSHLEDVL